eukprot:gene6303-7025_t
MEERPQSPSRPSTEPQSKENTQQQQESVTTNLFTLQNVKSNVVLLQTAKTIAHPVNNPQDFKNVRVILDSCSQRSYITTELRDKLKLPTISSHEILIKEFGNETGTLNKCDLVNLALKSKDGGSITISAFVVKTICSPVSSQAIDVAKNMYSHLKGLILADSGSGAEDVEIDVLIGADYVYTVMLDKVVRGEHSNSPVATATRFGYVLNGPVQLPGNTIVSSNIISSHVLKSSVVIYNDEVLSNQVKQFWDIESAGIKTKAEIPESYDDDILKDKYLIFKLTRLFEHFNDLSVAAASPPSFFNQWKTEYLTSLRERASRVSSKSSLRVPRQGEFVSIAKDKIPRQRWAMGKITKVFHEVDVEENKQDEKNSEQDMPIKFVADEDVSELICNDK